MSDMDEARRLAEQLAIAPRAGFRSAAIEIIAPFLSAARAEGPKWQATHEHYQGGLYRVIARGKMEADLSPVVIYDNEKGDVWVRAVEDFDQTDPFVRFAALPDDTKPDGGKG